jgi:condensin complex subunit 1
MQVEHVSSVQLAQLVFFVGHVAIKQIVYMESIEAELKRRKGDAKAKQDASKAKQAAETEDDLDQAAGPTEDDVSEIIGQLRERELLYGKQSMFGIFAPMIVHMCKSNKTFSVWCCGFSECCRIPSCNKPPRLHCPSSCA